MSVVRDLTERFWFFIALTLGALLRAARYSTTRVVGAEDALHVEKRRSVYAPMLVWLCAPLMRILDTGVRVLPSREWAERERRMYDRLYRAPVRMDADGTIILPWLRGETLAALLEDRSGSQRLQSNHGCDRWPRTQQLLQQESAIALVVTALAKLHAQGLTHGDAMAENAMVDLEAGVARWFDFETVHDPRRGAAWRRADDLRALIATCVLRRPMERLAPTVALVLGVYGDDEVIRQLEPAFRSAFRRRLPFHLGQAPLSYRQFREIGRAVSESIRARNQARDNSATSALEFDSDRAGGHRVQHPLHAAHRRGG